MDIKLNTFERLYLLKDLTIQLSVYRILAFLGNVGLSFFSGTSLLLLILVNQSAFDIPGDFFIYLFKTISASKFDHYLFMKQYFHDLDRTLGEVKTRFDANPLGTIFEVVTTTQVILALLVFSNSQIYSIYSLIGLPLDVIYFLGAFLTGETQPSSSTPQQ